MYVKKGSHVYLCVRESVSTAKYTLCYFGNGSKLDMNSSIRDTVIVWYFKVAYSDLAL